MNIRKSFFIILLSMLSTVAYGGTVVSNNLSGLTYHGMMDEGENTAAIGVFGEQVVGAKISDIEISFDNEVNTAYDVNVTVTGDGAVTHENSYAMAASTTGTARMESKALMRYRAGHSGFINFTAAFDGTGTGYAGTLDAGSGLYIKKAGTDFCFGFRNSHGDTEQCKADFVGNYPVSSLNLAKINIFEISFGYLGVANPSLWVYAPNLSGKRLLHVLQTQGARDDTHIESPNLRMAIETSGDMSVKTGSWYGGTIGPDIAAGSGRPFHAALDGGALNATDLKTLATFHAKTTFNSKANRKAAHLISFEFFVDTPASGTGTVEFSIYKNATLTGVASYTDVKTNSSVMEYDTAQTYSSGGDKYITRWVSYVGANRGGNASTQVIDAAKLGLIAFPNDTFTITAQNVDGSTAVNVRMTFNWDEK